MMGEDLAATLSAYRDRIAHVQIADVPGRGAPGTGTLDFEPLFAQLAAQEYAGSVGLEYLPADPSDSSTSFGWLTREPKGRRAVWTEERGAQRRVTREDGA